jgi:hypothetical protein
MSSVLGQAAGRAKGGECQGDGRDRAPPKRRREEVEKISPDLASRSGDGKANSARYEAVNAMLLNEFLKEHRKVEEQQDTIAQLKAADAKQEEKISALTELVKAQAAQIQKVSAQLEVNKPAPQMVVNDQ